MALTTITTTMPKDRRASAIDDSSGAQRTCVNYQLLSKPFICVQENIQNPVIKSIFHSSGNP